MVGKVDVVGVIVSWCPWWMDALESLIVESELVSGGVVNPVHCVA